MGCGEKTTTSNSTTATATPEEQKLNQLQLQRIQGNAPMQAELDKNLFNTINTLLTGGNLPGNLQGIAGITEDQTQQMANQAVRDIMPGFQSGGIIDSGVAAQLATRAAADVRNVNAQFNVSALQNILNQALGGGSNLQGNTTSSYATLGNQLSGLRSVNGSQTTIGMNPFLKSFQTSLGKSLGEMPTTMANNMNSQQIAKMGAMAGCWVASEIFGGWYEFKTVMARYFINNLAPKWFKEFYLNNGEKIADFIKDKPVFKALLRPIFELMVFVSLKKVGNLCHN